MGESVSDQFRLQVEGRIHERDDDQEDQEQAGHEQSLFPLLRWESVRLTESLTTHFS